MIPNYGMQLDNARGVVNCFQNCIFTYDSQQKRVGSYDWSSCELLSELYFYLWFPTYNLVENNLELLWIAFRIVFLLMIPNDIKNSSQPNQLWIAFRIVFLLMIPNWAYGNERGRHCCELLSELYFYLWFPTYWGWKTCGCLLWIAFRIVFLLMIPNLMLPAVKDILVVNCFQNCIFTYDSQQSRRAFQTTTSCELLSELYFYLWFPTSLQKL